MQYWPRKRAKFSLARIRSWVTSNKAKPLGIIGYKAGMTHVQVVDNRPKSLTKGEKITLPVTVIDCPPMQVVGVSFYKKSLLGNNKVTSIFAKKLPKDLNRKISLQKKEAKNLDSVKEFDDLRLLVASNLQKNTKPKIIEMVLGGSKEEKLAYAKENLGKELPVKDILEEGSCVDVHGITKGKGFQGTVKRYGVPIRQHKSEKVKRGIGNLGAWTPKRVLFNVPQPGKMGYHLRTEYNKQIIKIGETGEDVNPKGGFTKYGLVKHNYLLVKGSVVGPRKRAVVLTEATRKNKKYSKDSYEVNYISK